MRKQNVQKNLFANLTIEDDAGDEPEIKSNKNKKQNTKPTAPKKTSNAKPQVSEQNQAPEGFTMVKKPPRKPKKVVDTAIVAAQNDPLAALAAANPNFFGTHPMRNFAVILEIMLQSEILVRHQVHGPLSEVCKSWYIVANSIHVWKAKTLLNGYATKEQKKAIQSYPANEQAKLWRKLFLDTREAKRREAHVESIKKNPQMWQIPDEMLSYEPKDARRRKKHYSDYFM